jgi:hypothetical protein
LNVDNARSPADQLDCPKVFKGVGVGDVISEPENQVPLRG